MNYIFDKSSKKFICPNCKKKRFVRFIDIATNIYLEDFYGKCDRETNCGYFNKPDNSFAKHYISIAKPTLNPIKNSQLINFHEKEVLQCTLKKYSNNNFYQYLISLFSKEEVQNVFEKYKVGTAKNWHGATVFWQIDIELNIRAGKILLFNKHTCKRVKDPYPHITWVHSKLKLEAFNLKQCLFGLHLVIANNKIAIVESEKTAVIMALFMPEYTWIATGSKQNFKHDLLIPIKGKEIIAFPDKAEFNDWHAIANSLNKLGYNITVSDYVEKLDCKTGTDLADLYISVENATPKIELNKEELVIKRLATINPELLNLIETFDLCDSFDNVIEFGKLKNINK